MKRVLAVAAPAWSFGVGHSSAEEDVNVWSKTLSRDRSTEILTQGRVLSFEALGVGRGGISTQHVLFVDHDDALFACRIHLERTFDNMAGEYGRDVVARCSPQLND